mmetsp:Transcript_22046/g.45633  ORF Transcript_22046/g.45633 Transcript_22046/m.45633 type:complete len:98 (-) Transcript_22046:1399-1692(-)
MYPRSGVTILLTPAPHISLTRAACSFVRCRAHFVETHPAVPSPVRRKGGHPSAREVLPGAAAAAAVAAAAGTEAASALLDAAGVITQEKGVSCDFDC